jgi:hypothetical protein
MLMVTSIMENGKMTRRTVSASTIILMGHVTKEIGSRTNNTDKAKKSGQTTHVMKGNTKMVKSTVKVSSFGPMVALTQETFSKTTSMESESTPGLMAANTMVNGRTANNTVLVSIIPQEVMKRKANGLMASVWNGSLNEYFV